MRGFPAVFASLAGIRVSQNELPPLSAVRETHAYVDISRPPDREWIETQVCSPRLWG